jgi:lipid-A-disaccharide synthase
MKYYIIAGEASGDLHASNLMKALSVTDRNAEFRGWGGDLMIGQGLQAEKHIRDVAFMGFTEVISHLPEIMKNFRLCKKDILQWNPDVVILVDYPGFNLRMARFLSKNGLRVFYYISPQVWAWKQSRVKKIKAYTDRLYVILPFEKDFYRKHGMEAEYEGHPLMDVIPYFIRSENPADFAEKNSLGKLPLVALLPGSRKQEIKRMLPLMAETAAAFPWHTFVVAGAPNIPESFYRSILLGKTVKVVYGQTYALLSNASAALVTSGTATLETALFRVPEIVCYKGSTISYHIARRLIKVPYISLVNLIMGKEVVKELIQDQLNTESLKQELDKLLNDPQARNKMLRDFDELAEKLGQSGVSAKLAKKMFSRLQQQA